MNKTIKDFFLNMTQEQIDSLAFEIAASFLQSDKEALNFYSSKKFLNILKQINKELQVNSFISDNEYQKILFGTVTNEDFIKFINCLFNTQVAGCEIVKNPDGDFDSEQIVFLNLKITKIYGQGTAYSIEKISKKV